MSSSLRSTVRRFTSLMAGPGIASAIFVVSSAAPVAAQQIGVRQASSLDSLVTVDEMSRACSRLVKLPALVAETQSNLDEARFSAVSTDTAARREHDQDISVRTIKLDSANAQLTTWKQLFQNADSATLTDYCNQTGTPSTWKPVAIPSRQLVKRVGNPQYKLPFNPRNEPLGATAALGFLGISEANIVGGVAKFLVDRASLEIQLAFVERIKRVACDTLHKPLFGSTCQALSETPLVLNVSSMRQLRSSAEQDLRRLPRSGPLALVLKRSATIGTATTQDKSSDFLVATYFVGSDIEQLLEGRDPLSALSATLDLDGNVLGANDPGGLFTAVLERDKSTVITLPISAGLQRLALVARMLPDSNADGRPQWPTTSEGHVSFARALLVNVNAWIPELGITTVPKRDALIASVVTLSRQIDETRDRAKTLADRLATLKASDTASLAAFARYVDDGLAIAESWATVIDGWSPKDTALVRTISDLRVVATGLASREYAQAATGILSVANRSGVAGIQIPAGTQQFVSFVTASAQATSTDDFAKTLESFAAPVESYRTKRTATHTYFVINGYLGASAGREISNGGGSGYAGAAAPVGVEVGWGNLGGHQWSFSLFAQAIDVGALASYRMNASTDDLASEPKVGFAQVFSPGGSLLFGIPHIPLTFGPGWNVVPQLRKVTAAGVTTDQKRNATRFAFMLGVDIPIFAFK